MKHIHLFVIAVLALCIFAGSVYAGGEPMLSKGDRQLVFRFEGLSYLGLRSYFPSPGGICEDDYCIDDCYTCGGGFGIRYFINDGRAVRFGVNIAYGADTWADEYGDGHDKEVSCLGFGFDVMYEKYFPTIHSIAPYMGVGLGYMYNSQELKGSESCDAYKRTFNGNSFDVMGALGFQWYFTQGMSLGGEYRVAYMYQSGKCEIEPCDGDKYTWSDYSGNHLNWYPVAFYLSVHF
ncbi:MAG: outer membrane beta-barrel protein [bacterium]